MFFSTFWQFYSLRVIRNWVSFYRTPFVAVNFLSEGYPNSTLSIAVFSNFKQWILLCLTFEFLWAWWALLCLWHDDWHHLLFAVSNSLMVFLVYAWLILMLQQEICKQGFEVLGAEGDLSILMSSFWLWCSMALLLWWYIVVHLR